jgi:hypothetical protein
MASPNAQVFRSRMLEALDEYMRFKAEAKRIKTEVEQTVRVTREKRPHPGGQPTPLPYHVDVALSKHYFYTQARQDRDAARWNAIMWGVAALVASQES